MTEQEWLTSDDPVRVMTSIKDRISFRKAQLFNLACSRDMSAWWTTPLAERKLALDEKIIECSVIEDAEMEPIREALSVVAGEAWQQARRAFEEQSSSATRMHLMAQYVAVAFAESSVLSEFGWWDWIASRVLIPNPSNPEELCNHIELELYRRNIPLLRCIVGNPFRPVTCDPSWLTSTVTALARGIYDDRAFDRLPILADALQDAGCEDADVLNHCRGSGPHARGCWVVDLLLGKA